MRNMHDKRPPDINGIIQHHDRRPHFPAIPMSAIHTSPAFGIMLDEPANFPEGTLRGTLAWRLALLPDR